VVDDRADKLSKEEFDEADVALAHLEIASSTMPAMAVNSSDVSEDELEEDNTIDTGLVDLGGGCPLKMSVSPLSSTWDWDASSRDENGCRGGSV
jgi:hypothetical protein